MFISPLILITPLYLGSCATVFGQAVQGFLMDCAEKTQQGTSNPLVFMMLACSDANYLDKLTVLGRVVFVSTTAAALWTDVGFVYKEVTVIAHQGPSSGCRGHGGQLRARRSVFSAGDAASGEQRVASDKETLVG
ncbi:hypothetical protein HPB47_019230 [Ixodes persulcatus]|uniref:Uncharacterized protein n=1 Tax=Ixodes persulcatus TaxID=34615 RepID=A0AC60QZP5_IXOPE|nr:hypothetical protein HPB47_019230 [Ixodes persulcatus]